MSGLGTTYLGVWVVHFWATYLETELEVVGDRENRH